VTRCKGCGKEYRKGVLAFLLGPEGLKGARVCQACASGGVLLVAPKLAPVVRQAVTRPEGLERAIRMLRTYAKAADSQGKAELEDFLRGKAEGFEDAIECIKRECGI
jgi:hypothetical protein